MKKVLSFVFILSIFLPLFSFASFDTNLKYGTKGQTVSELQDFLQNQGFLTTKPNGYFGLGTLKAVKAFQKAQGIKPLSGYFGPVTRIKANVILSAIINNSDIAEKTETGTVVAPISQNFKQVVWDACKNIEGIQSIAPSGMYVDNGNCLPIINNNPNSNITTSVISPLVDIKVNGSDGPITVFYGAYPVISWTSKNVLSCDITKSDGGKWFNVGLSGSKDNIGLSNSTLIVTIQCEGSQLSNGNMINSTFSDSVTINVDQSTIPSNSFTTQ